MRSTRNRMDFIKIREYTSGEDGELFVNYAVLLA